MSRVDFLSYTWQRSSSHTYRKWFIFHTMWPPPDEKHGVAYILGLFTPAACGAEGKLRVIIIRVWKCWQLYIAQPALLAKWLTRTHSDTVTHTCFYRTHKLGLKSLKWFHFVWGICLPDTSVPSRCLAVMLLCGPCILSLTAWTHYPLMWLMLLPLVA